MRNRYKNVLIVEDDEVMLFYTCSVIEKMDIAERIICQLNGQEALNYIRSHCIDSSSIGKERCPDLILLDIHMPVMDGFEFLQALHQLGQRLLIESNVVMLSSSFHSRDRKAAQELGIKYYIEKPLTENKLLAVF